MSNTVALDKVEQLDSVVEQVASKYEAGANEVHVLGDIISQYLKKPSGDLDSEELRDDIKFELKSALEHDGHM